MSPRSVPISLLSSDLFRFALLVFGNTPICSDVFRFPPICSNLFSEQIRTNQRNLGRTFTRLTRVSLVTRVWRRFFGGPFGLKTQENKQRTSREGPFFVCAKVGLHETLVIVPKFPKNPFLPTHFARNGQSLTASAQRGGQLSQAIPQFHVERI